jgi:hypothetical protein
LFNYQVNWWLHFAVSIRFNLPDQPPTRSQDVKQLMDRLAVSRRFITVANKRRQTTVILTVPPVLKPCGFIFMEPGFVSYRLIRPVILKSLLVKLSCG